MNKRFIIKGDIAYIDSNKKLITKKNNYLIINGKYIEGVFDTIPDGYKDYELIDKTNMLIIPGLVDLHLHAPQYSYRGTAMDLQLLEWLNTYTFPEESKYKDLEYAKKSYEVFVDDLKNSLTTRAVIFATIHPKATTLLADLLEKTNLVTEVGLVNMDRESPDYYIAKDFISSLNDTELYINNIKDYQNVTPIVTPRFTPTCTDSLMEGLGKLKSKYNLKVQSHLDENVNEIELVKSLCPDSKNYADTYERYDLLEGSVMAHCVHLLDDEIKSLKEKNVFIAHCPDSNTNLNSGIAPIKKYLDLGMNVGIGSDVAGGSNLNLLANLKLAIQVSKILKMETNGKIDSLTLEDAFYLGTLGGGKFFGNVGSFIKGYEADILVINDKRNNRGPLELSIKDRLERIIYFGDERLLDSKFVRGVQISISK